MSEQLYTVTATVWGKPHRSTGLTHKQAKGALADFESWGINDAAMTPEPNLVWSALTVDQRRERERFWQAVFLSVSVGALFALLFWCSTIGVCKAWRGHMDRVEHGEPCK